MSLEPGQEVMDGVVLANVASGVTAGTELGTSATEGEVASGSDGFSALTDEGAVAGLSTNESVPAGYAGVQHEGAVTYEAGETVSPGDVCAINSGTLATADGTTDTNPLFVVGHGAGEDGGTDYASGDEVPVYMIE